VAQAGTTFRKKQRITRDRYIPASAPRRLRQQGIHVTVPNRELYEELGLSRFAKYRALRYLEQIGAIAIFQDGKTVMRVSLLW
jgi:hypothetical protein